MADGDDPAMGASHNDAGLPTASSTHPHLVRCSGGAAGSRTPDLRRAKAALSQLSYSPVVDIRATQLRPNRDVVGVRGLEPRASPLSGVCSNQLS